MPDDEPLSTAVSETVATETNVDKETTASLNASFQDFWEEKDKESGDDAPAAPGDGAGQETKESKTDEKPEKVDRPETHAKEYTDKEIDDWDLTPENPQIQKQFRDIKQLWHADRAKAKTEAERAAKLETELAQARENSLTPEVKADYEHAAAVRRRFDFASDPEFLQRYHEPVKNHFISILNEAVEVLPDRQAAAAWAKYIADNYSPDQLDRSWWLNSVIAKVPNDLDRSSLLSSVTQLLKMQKERDSEVTRRTNDKTSFDNWIQEKAQTTSQRVQAEIMSEIGEQEKRIAEVLPRDVASAKTADERRAIEDHNERFTKLNSFFQETMKDISANGPRAWVRASVEATRAKLLDGEYKEMEQRAKSAEKERDQLRKELDKITGARRKISQTSGTPPTPSGKDKNGTSLSIKDLDIRKSFDKFDWGESS